MGKIEEQREIKRKRDERDEKKTTSGRAKEIGEWNGV